MSFLEVPPDSDFPLQNLPFGIFSAGGGSRRVGVAIGEHVLDLSRIAESGLFPGPHLQGTSCFAKGDLNDFMAMGRSAWRECRAMLLRLLSAQESILRDNTDLRRDAILPMSGVDMHLPASVGDYTDFYASREHATNVGTMFRGKDNALQPNWLHLPVGYHGRASSIVVSGTDVVRPWGQVLPKGSDVPEFRPSSVVDYEVEVAAFMGPGNEMGTRIPVSSAQDHIFGLTLMNDWSARDVQKWEYVPLGPFTAKNFATSVAPWVVTLEALEPFACAPPEQSPEVLPYLREGGVGHTYDVALEVAVLPAGAAEGTVAGRSNLRDLYWTFPQMLAHHTSTGCNMRPGDMLGSGTISSEGEDGAGSLLERSWGGTRQVALAGGASRTYLEDGDAVVMRGTCGGAAAGHGPPRIGFGECRGRLLPAR